MGSPQSLFPARKKEKGGFFSGLMKGAEETAHEFPINLASNIPVVGTLLTINANIELAHKATELRRQRRTIAAMAVHGFKGLHQEPAPRTALSSSASISPYYAEGKRNFLRLSRPIIDAPSRASNHFLLRAVKRGVHGAQAGTQVSGRMRPNVAVSGKPSYFASRKPFRA